MMQIMNDGKQPDRSNAGNVALFSLTQPRAVAVGPEEAREAGWHRAV